MSSKVLTTEEKLDIHKNFSFIIMVYTDIICLVVKTKHLADILVKKYQYSHQSVKKYDEVVFYYKFNSKIYMKLLKESIIAKLTSIILSYTTHLAEVPVEVYKYKYENDYNALLIELGTL